MKIKQSFKWGAIIVAVAAILLLMKLLAPKSDKPAAENTTDGNPVENVQNNSSASASSTPVNTVDQSGSSVSTPTLSAIENVSTTKPAVVEQVKKTPTSTIEKKTNEKPKKKKSDDRENLDVNY